MNIVRHVIIYAHTNEERNRLRAFLKENENDYAYIRGYNRAEDSRTGRVYSCRTEKAQFMIRLKFAGRNFVV